MKNIEQVLQRLDNKDPMVEEYKDKRIRRYSGPMPLSIGRHIILSDDVKGVSFSVSSVFYLA